MATVRLKRVYEPPSRRDGKRVLVERLWPRGVAKRAAALDEWLKEAAPSTSLRRWFAHDPAKWSEFKRRYFAELDQKPDVLSTIDEWLRGGSVTLLFAAKETRYNNAVALKEYLEKKRNPGRGDKPPP